MKKTILAASVAALVAAPAAFADVKIGGNVIQEFVSDDASGNSDNGLSSAAAVDLVFSVSEDLGNGMSAFAKIHTLRDNGGSGNANQVVGIKGDFGSITAGRMESFTEGKVSAMSGIGSSDALSIEHNRGFKTGRAEGGLAYVSPSFNGFTFGVAGFAMNNTGAAGSTTTATLSGVTGTIDISNSGNQAISAAGGGALTALTISSAATSEIKSTTTTAANVTDQSANFDAIDVMVQYANGPMLVRLSREMTDSQTFNSSTAKDQTIMNLGVNYKIGDTKLVGTFYEVENGDGQDTNDVDGYMVGIEQKMGANTFALGYTEEDSLSSGDKATGQDESWIVSIDHALSKRTSVTAAYKSHDDQTASSDLDQFAVGIKHVF